MTRNDPRHPDHAAVCRGVRGPVYDPGQCRLCWLATYDARYREHFARDGPAEPGGRTGPIPPCVHSGDELTGADRAARGLDHTRRWRFCLNPSLPLGEAVCSCRGCNPTCPGYAPGM